MLSDAKNISPKLPLPVKEFQTKRNKRLKNIETIQQMQKYCYCVTRGLGTALLRWK